MTTPPRRSLLHPGLLHQSLEDNAEARLLKNQRPITSVIKTPCLTVATQTIMRDNAFTAITE